MPSGISFIGDLTIVESGGEITSQSVGDKALKTTAADDSTLEVSSNTGKMQLKDAGSSLTNGVSRTTVSKYAGRWFRGALSASDSTAGVFQAQNTYGSDLLITRAMIYVTTVSSGACTIDVGVGSSSSTSYDNLLDGIDVNGSTGVSDNIKSLVAGDNGRSVVVWKNNEYVNASKKTGATSGLVGYYAFYCVDITA
tara:strand:+ start:10369 stop:10956 length:588 start_codon:yes stop_codon:yes gene_type:complete